MFGGEAPGADLPLWVGRLRWPVGGQGQGSARLSMSLTIIIGPWHFVFAGLSGLRFFNLSRTWLISYKNDASSLLINEMLEKIGSKRWWLLNWLRWVGGGDLGRPSRRISEPRRGAREGNSITDYGIGVTVNCLLPFPCQSSHLWIAPCPGLGRQVRAQTGGGARMWVAREPGSHPRCHCCASRSYVCWPGRVLSDSKYHWRSLMGCRVAKHLGNHCLFLDDSFGLILVLFDVVDTTNLILY